MILKSPAISRVLLVRPGATEFDDQGRIKGSMDMPMSETGRRQAETLADQISHFRCRTIHTAPCESARETAEMLAEGRGAKVKVIEAFRNLDHGLWHGKLIDELKRNHPKLYRRGQESPWDICPPGGESIGDAQVRVVKAVRKLLKKNHDELITIVIPDPMAWIVQNLLSGETLSNLWKAETDSAKWDLIEPIMD
ncbi:Phosphoserine phosphatase 1 [Rubripirellula lacrimiformis]|uniref:Phosphoserine phosphatase 1 n=1 Tax=Rubripirellula lacrimiformis TaxID=1930273 RepID=A0A517NGE5_9BACT|nr:histidine phosphatase family protein [Rubripirellula lacrimiformis]QDT06191.1 Phosphoserine phosphatase 1 [Rubripirellula lacrimiformis]